MAGSLYKSHCRLLTEILKADMIPGHIKTCEDCGRLFNSRWGRRRHRARPKPQTSITWTCSNCQASFPDTRTLFQHARTHHYSDATSWEISVTAKPDQACSSGTTPQDVSTGPMGSYRREGTYLLSFFLPTGEFLPWTPGMHLLTLQPLYLTGMLVKEDCKTGEILKRVGLPRAIWRRYQDHMDRDYKGLEGPHLDLRQKWLAAGETGSYEPLLPVIDLTHDREEGDGQDRPKDYPDENHVLCKEEGSRPRGGQEDEEELPLRALKLEDCADSEPEFKFEEIYTL